MEYKISCPVTGDELKKLRAGDRVLLSGTVYTARDAAHKRLTELIESGKELPFPMKGAAIYYVGPTPERPGEVIGSAGPTTSGRVDCYTPALLSRGLRIMIGKGSRSEAVIAAIAEHGAVYLAAVGGAGALMSSSVISAEPVCYEDLGCEAVRRLEVRDMPLIVAVDSAGGDLYKSGPAAYLEHIKENEHGYSV